MVVIVVDHPLVAHKATLLRDQDTDSPTFRRLTQELAVVLAVEATSTMPLSAQPIHTPIGPMVGQVLVEPSPLVVPILRAGLGMLEGFLQVIPTATVGFLGLVRDEETLTPSTYAERLPKDLAGRTVFVLDPMIATGGSLVHAIQFCFGRGAARVVAVSLLASPEGLDRVTRETKGMPVTVVLAAIDEHLNDVGYIVPGLGDAGDRLYGDPGD
jgi:uracil phosphoribosyltransferase